MAERHNISELNELYADSKSAYEELFSEQRSNIQLVAGDHYSKKFNRFWNRVRSNTFFSDEQKIRLTKNHIRRIILTYINSISNYAPGVTATARDKSNLQNQKSAELVNAVWQDAKERMNYREKFNQWVYDFCCPGEVAVKIYFDPLAGKFLGVEAELDENGQVQLDDQGQPVPSDRAKFSGDVVIERLFTFNLKCPAGTKSAQDAPWWEYDKMVDISDVKALIDQSNVLDDAKKEKLKSKIQETADQTFVVMDSNNNKYKQVKHQTMLKEWYFKPCPQYPLGYFYICTNDDIIFEGELPFGVYPIVFQGFDEIPTSPRYRSLVKQLRPYQIEINRCASTIAEHQITMGWDKVLIQSGTKLQPGIAFPGVRSFSYSGMTPVVMEGRTGNQYLEYMQSQIAEMYSIAQLEEQVAEKDLQVDVVSMLSRSLKDKKKFSIYTDKFENFLKNVFKTYIKLKQKYATPQDLIPAIGKSEIINIDEFKGVEDICYSINLEPQSEDSETKLGKQLMLQHIIQYVGPQLAQKDLGKLIRLMPYANDEMILEDLTMEYDFTNNLMLNLERGRPAAVNQYVDAAYVINKLTTRTVKADFPFLNPQIQQLYFQAIQMYEQAKTDQEMKLKQAQSEFIPTGGYLVACDFYVPDPMDPSKLPKRVRLPSEAMDWLIKQLNSQGSSQQNLSQVPQGALAEMSTSLINQLRPPMASQPGAMPPLHAPASAIGGLNGRY